MKHQIQNIKNKILNNTKVVENYFFMTLLQVLSSAFGILIYPYLIRTLGSESYGIYIFAIAVVTYFIDFTGFGFQLTGLKLIEENKSDRAQKSRILSSLLSAKIYLAVLSAVIFIPSVFIFTQSNQTKILFFIVFSQLIAEVIYPQWYFRAIQKMKIVTYTQLSFRLASLPFIFLLVKSPSDILTFAIISVISVILPAVALLIYILKTENVNFQLVSLKNCMSYILDTFPIFVSSFIETVKQESTVLLIGILLGMKEVAMFDLARKIILLPRMLLANINVAIYPKLRLNSSVKNIRKIIFYEWIIGLTIIATIFIFGYPIVLLLGGKQMSETYPILLFLSFTLLTWLVVGAYNYHVFIPNKLNYTITKTQLVSLCSFLLFLLPNFIFVPNLKLIVLALSISSIVEIVFTTFVIKKMQLL